MRADGTLSPLPSACDVSPIPVKNDGVVRGRRVVVLAVKSILRWRASRQSDFASTSPAICGRLRLNADAVRAPVA